MESERYHYVKVAGSKPELFVKVWLQEGILVKTGEAISEVDLRKGLSKEGRTNREIEEVILRARENAA